MFDEKDIETIKKHLHAGLTPEQVAEKIGITRGSFHHKVLKSGYEIEVKVTRDIRPIRPIGTAAVGGG